MFNHRKIIDELQCLTAAVAENTAELQKAARLSEKIAGYFLILLQAYGNAEDAEKKRQENILTAIINLKASIEQEKPFPKEALNETITATIEHLLNKYKQPKYIYTGKTQEPSALTKAREDVNAARP
jgi:L-lysine 2,3-aminomutase